jgi:TonB family protein
MGRSVQRPVIVVWMLWAAINVMAQDQTLDQKRLSELNKQVQGAFAAGDLSGAKTFANEVREMVERSYGTESSAAANAYLNLGTISIELTDWSDAATYLGKAYEIFAKAKKANGAQLLRILSLKAAAEENLEKRAEADGTYLQALEVVNSYNLKDSRETYSVILGAANALSRAKRFSAAQPLYLRSLRIAYEHFDVTSDARVNVLVYRHCLGDMDIRIARTKLQEEEQRLKEVESKTKNIKHGKATWLPAPRYTAESKARFEYGFALVRVTIDEKGRVAKAIPLCSSPRLGGSALEAAKMARFEPTLVDDKPVAVQQLLVYRFILPQ